MLVSGAPSNATYPSMSSNYTRPIDVDKSRSSDRETFLKAIPKLRESDGARQCCADKVC